MKRTAFGEPTLGSGPGHGAGDSGMSPYRAAKIAGAAYLITMASAMFAEFYVRGKLVVRSDAVATASNILANESLFRAAILADVLTWVGVIVLVWALFELLAPVDRSVARLAAFFRVVEVAILGSITVNSLLVLIILGSPEYLQTFERGQLQSLARLLLGAESTGYRMALLFSGLGTVTFSSLLLRSGYIPRALATLGILAGSVMALYLLASIPLPAFGRAAYWAGFLPIIVFEVSLGVWLLAKGVRVAA